MKRSRRTGTKRAVGRLAVIGGVGLALAALALNGAPGVGAESLVPSTPLGRPIVDARGPEPTALPHGPPLNTLPVTPVPTRPPAPSATPRPNPPPPTATPVVNPTSSAPASSSGPAVVSAPPVPSPTATRTVAPTRAPTRTAPTPAATVRSLPTAVAAVAIARVRAAPAPATLATVRELPRSGGRDAIGLGLIGLAAAAVGLGLRRR